MAMRVPRQGGAVGVVMFSGMGDYGELLFG